MYLKSANIVNGLIFDRLTIGHEKMLAVFVSNPFSVLLSLRNRLISELMVLE